MASQLTAKPLVVKEKLKGGFDVGTEDGGIGVGMIKTDDDAPFYRSPVEGRNEFLSHRWREPFTTHRKIIKLKERSSTPRGSHSLWQNFQKTGAGKEQLEVPCFSLSLYIYLFGFSLAQSSLNLSSTGVACFLDQW